eukprot:CAMPEP_0201723390 /NCGR_PEP_ID=MMETSP0593-20130828/7461_1 /ASSEMBLY_ACC=CAM_ASM_000672 /TAXON_ID=267983 /ORGANISM="Skeletonema japonicum, Strain CCMP2506" /LENGTH=41 /DNA_ID= /DNA_START= /DNA_END= /DNA_ORIENTATION=
MVSKECMVPSYDELDQPGEYQVTALDSEYAAIVVALVVRLS